MIQSKKIVDSYSEEIVKIINSLDNEKGFANSFAERTNSKIGKNQLAKILNSIKTANSIEEIKLFICYQGSKCKHGESWNTAVGNDSTLCKKIIEKIDEVLNLFNKEDLEKKGLEYPTETRELIELKLKLGEKFFGYLYWKGTIYAKGGNA